MRRWDCDVLVIGAGPAGSAAARVLAARGRDVLLIDRFAFPRDKICGDALLPDVMRALDRLSLRERVIAVARRLDRLTIYSPDRRAVDLRGEFACLPRRVLDDVLRCAAMEAGARFAAPFRVTAPCVEGGIVRGATLTDRTTGDRVTVRAGHTVLATGAAAEVLRAFDVCERWEASAIAARVYVEASTETDTRADALVIAYDRSVFPGYGWIFPGPGRVFDLGVGFFHDHPRPSVARNIREMFARFVGEFEPARALCANGRVVAPLRGAPLRTAFTGSRCARPGLFVVGEAAGLTYSFSGEGIGKAMESGIIAAEVIDGSSTADADHRRLAVEYETRLTREFTDRYRAYATAQRWLGRRAIANLLVRRANRGSFVRGRLEDILHERTDPRALFSMAGLVRALVS